MTTPAMIHTGVSLKGRYQIQRIKADSGKVIQSSPWMNNLITHAGKDIYIGSPDYYLTGAVGTGNSTPDVSNSALDNLLHRKGAAEVNAVSPVFSESGGTVKSIFRYRFNPGEAVGNISELGIYLNRSSYHYVLFSRALVRDSHGNPTTITVLSDEYLDVYWEFTLEVEGRTTGTFPLYNKDGTISTFNWVMKPAAYNYWQAHVYSSMLALPNVRNDGYYSYLYANVDTEPSYLHDIPPGHSHDHSPNWGIALPYIEGSYYRDYDFVWLLDRANISGINCFRLLIGPGYLWLYLPNHSLEKTEMDTLTLRFRLTLT